MAVIGKPIDRVDARLKVTGAAKYAAEFNQANMAYAYPIRAKIGSGAITAFDRSAAEKSAGVLAVLTHENAPRLKAINAQDMAKTGGFLGENLVPIQDNKVNYFGQYIGLIIAETYEQARNAARVVKITYAKETPAIELEKELPNAMKPQRTRGEDVQINEGKTASIIEASPVKIEQTYTTSTENHHPMEPHATIAVWESADKLTVYDATQSVKGVQGISAYFFSLKPENVRIISPYVGGGFGCKGAQWAHILLAAMAGQVVKRPVKLVLTRQMMVTNVGRRAETIQKIALASDRSGKLTAIRHQNSTYANLSQFFEQSGVQTKSLYAAPLREITYKVAKLNVGTPTFMRAPGETPGTFALESAMDELAYELKIDPIQLRILNHAATDPHKKLPFSSEFLRECFQTGAEKFGWARRNAVPRQMRHGKYLVGMGMATATYPANRGAASVKVQMLADGSVKVQSATQDIGTGTYTIMAQTAADALGIPVERIKVEVGDSSFPPAPVSGGSMTTASVNPAVSAACEMLKKQIFQTAAQDKTSKFFNAREEIVSHKNGGIYFVKDGVTTESYIDIMRRSNKVMLEACATAKPFAAANPNETNTKAKNDQQSGGGNNQGGNSSPCSPMQADEDVDSNQKKYSFHSFGAQFAEVWVDEDLGTIRVKRFTSVHDVGRIMNEKTARSQIIGGVIYGLGSALMEQTEYDKRWANPVTRTLADYHVPVNLDVPPIDVYFIGKPDPHISPIGARGIGEIGTTGVSAAVANAVFNATGRRLRDLPLTPDKLL